MNERPSQVHDRETAAGRSFVYRHIVSFEETNLVGNVYFARYVSWQGRCREMFLHQNVPNLVEELAKDLRLITIRVSCDYFEELSAFDQLTVEMRLSFLRANRIGLDFDYVADRGVSKQQVARGFQEIGCFTLSSVGLSPCPIPRELAASLTPYE